MKTQFIFILTIYIMVSACNPQKDKTFDQMSKKELTEWFNNGKWKRGWDPLPDESVNIKEFAIQYRRNPQRWEKAFAFLEEKDLSGLKPGRYELEGADLFVIVDEYVTKDEVDVLFEAHKKYADIQYVVWGEEKIGILPLIKTTVEIPYNDEKDIVFLDSEDKNYRLATPDRFFIFFPEDAHQPCVKTNENTKIRKVVVKVKIK